MVATCNSFHHGHCSLASPYGHSYSFVSLTSKCWFCCELIVQVPEPVAYWDRSNNLHCRSAKMACRLEAVGKPEECKWFGVYPCLSLNNKPFFWISLFTQRSSYRVRVLNTYCVGNSLWHSVLRTQNRHISFVVVETVSTSWRQVFHYPACWGITQFVRGDISAGSGTGTISSQQNQHLVARLAKPYEWP